jgi:hypothetical protein
MQIHGIVWDRGLVLSAMRLHALPRVTLWTWTCICYSDLHIDSDKVFRAKQLGVFIMDK